MTITSKHTEYSANIDAWVKVDDVCKGQKAIKDKGKTYLPKPITFSDDEYREYLDRAVFYGVTGRTHKSNVGQAFNKLPDFKRPDDLEYLERNSDGSGRSIYQNSQRALDLIQRHYRCGIYVDYPQVAPSRIRAEDKQKNAFPMIHVLNAKSIHDWDHIIVGNQKKLSYVKIMKSVVNRTADGFGRETKDQYRVLRLEDAGQGDFIYSVQIYQQNEKGGWVEGPQYIPTDYHGKYWDYIPFTFCGAIDNTDEIYNAPILELADINLAHYRNSADVEESGFIVGQPIICMPDITHEQYRIVKEEGLLVGSRKGFPAKVEAVQVKENNLVKQLMTDKWVQMKEMGARLVEVGSANKTATQADNEDSVQHSVLSLAISNISEAFQMALRWCAKFALPNHDLKPDELTYVISQDFNKQKYDAVRSKLIYEACLSGRFPMKIWYQYEQTGTFPEDKWDEIEKLIEQAGDGSLNKDE